MNAYNLSPFTFGATQSAQNLVKILIERNDKKEIRKIAGTINRYRFLFNQCEKLDESCKKEVLRIIMEKGIKKINNLKFDKRIISHTRNVIMTSYRIHLKKSMTATLKG